MTYTPSPRRSILAAAIVSLTALGAAFTTQAAVITWGAATNIAGDTDVSTNGLLVGAFNLGGSGVTAATVNTVTFAGLNGASGTATSGNFSVTGLNFAGQFGDSGAAPFSTLSASYQNLLGNLGGINSGGGPFTLTMSGLTVGQSYEFQWWSNSSEPHPVELTTGTAGGGVTLSGNTTPGVNGGLGQFAIGTFIADNAAQVISFTETGNGSAFINGFQLRQTSAAVPGTAVPEPGSALVGMMVLGLCGTRFGRRQRA